MVAVRALFLIAGLALAPPSAGAAPASGPRLGEPYTQPFAGFALRLLPEWKAGETISGAVVSFYGPPDKYYIPRLDVLQARLVSDSTLDDFLGRWKSANAKAFPGWSLVEESPTAVHGVLGARLVSTLGGKDAPLKNLSLALGREDRVFLLSFNTGRGYFDRYAPRIERCMRSFRFLPEAKLDGARRREFQRQYDAAFEHQKAGRREEALAAFRAAAELLPAYADLHRALGGLYAELGRPDEAAASYGKVVELDPDNADAHYNLGTLLYRQERKSEAERLFRKAIQIDPEHAQAHINLGAALAGRKEWAEARKVLEAGCRLAPESAVGHLTLGRVYEALNEPRRAEREYKDALALEPGNAEAKAGVERLAANR